MKIEITYYAKLVQLPVETKRANGIKTDAKNPRFDAVRECGYCKAFNELRTKKGMLIFTLLPTDGVINSQSGVQAEKRLQGKDSLNFTSLYMRGQDSNGNWYAFGNPTAVEFYGKDRKKNPFYKENRQDCFLFIISADWQTMELFTIPNGLHTQQAYCDALKDGVLADKVKDLRERATEFYDYGTPL